MKQKSKFILERDFVFSYKKPPKCSTPTSHISKISVNFMKPIVKIGYESVKIIDRFIAYFNDKKIWNEY